MRDYVVKLSREAHKIQNNPKRNTPHYNTLTISNSLTMALSRFYNDPFFSSSVFHDADDFPFPTSDLDRWMMTPFSSTRFSPRFDRSWMMTPFPSNQNLEERRANNWLTSPLSRNGGCKVEEDENKYSFSLQAPGFRAEDMAVKMEETPNGGHMLLLSGKHCTEKKENENSMFSSESKFVQQFNLGHNVDTEKIEASLNDGVLRVNVAKKEPEKKPTAKVITITEGPSNKDENSVKTVKVNNGAKTE